MAARVDQLQPLPELELRVLARWRERDVASEARRRRDGAPARVIWAGPGELGVRVLADVFARYATMRGWHVDLRTARGCHDPAVERAAERRLGLACAPDVERHGIAEFAACCRETALALAAERDARAERMGVAPHGDGERAADPAHIESVWWAVREIAERGLLYEDVKVVAYCPRCRTAVAEDETTTLADVEEPAAYVRFKVARDGGPLQAGDELLVYTAAPWTLVANAAVAVDPELTYVRAKTGTLDAPVVVAEALVQKVLGHGAQVRILDRFRGAAIDGVRYEPPFGYLAASAFGERGHSVLLAGFVTATEGTGLAAMATAFSDDDLRLGARYGLAVVNPVGADGCFDERAGRYAGRRVQDAGAGLVEDLRARGRLLRDATVSHAAAHCGSCDARLLPYAKSAWHVATAGLEEDVRRAANGARVGTRPGRSADRLLSRERWWGTPLPVWRCADGHVTVIGSFDELEQRSGARLADPHRPWIDDVAFACACGRAATRVPDVVQPWLEAGAMPFAQRHEPFAGEQTLDELYPADLVCTAGDLLSSLLTVSALLRGGDPVCEHVVRARGDAGLEGADARGDAGLDGADARAEAGPAGADAQRWRVLAGGTQDPDLPRRARDVYELAAACDPEPAPPGELGELDRWVASRSSAAIERTGAHLDGYNAPAAARAIAAFADELCGWYVPRARARLHAGDGAARWTLRECVLTLARLLAPFTPFVADEIYLGLGGDEPSVHLGDWPTAGPRDLDLETAVGLAREA